MHMCMYALCTCVCTHMCTHMFMYAHVYVCATLVATCYSKRTHSIVREHMLYASLVVYDEVT